MPKRCIVFYDGQNLFHCAKDAWAPLPPIPGSPYGWPSYDVEALADAMIARASDRSLTQIRFYTGVPTPHQHKHWHDFWTNKLRYLENRKVHVYRGRINMGGQEKGVDVSIAIDLIRLTYEAAYDVAILISGDHDLGPAVKLAKEIAQGQKRQLAFEGVCPWEPGKYEPRGIPGTDWVKLSKQTYDACRDPKDYRGPKLKGSPN